MAVNIVLSITSILFSIFFLIYSLAIPSGDSLTSIGPSGWPRTILILMLILGIMLFFRTILSKNKPNLLVVKQSQEIEEEHKVEETLQEEPLFTNRHWLVASIIFIYFLGIQFIGFVLATPIFILVMAKLFGMSHWLKLAVTTLLCSTVIIYLFTIILTIPLPRGLGIFRSLSLLVY